MILSILAFVIILGIIISIHEFGHFYFARKAGILCHEFSIGFGPIIYRHQFGETLFCIRAIPIGGFVSMADGELTSNLIKVGDEIGLNTENELVSEIILDEKRECEIRGEVVSFDFYGKNDNPLYVTLNVSNEEKYFEVKRDAFYVFEKNQRLQIEPYERSFDSKSVLQRFLTLFAGPMMNFVLAIFIYIIVAFASGVPNTKSNVIGEVESDYPAAVAESLELDVEGNSFKIKKGQKITEVNGVPVNSWTDFSKELDKLYDENGTTVKLTIDGNHYTMETISYIVSIAVSNIGLEQDEMKYITSSVTPLQESVDETEVYGIKVGKCDALYKDKNGKLSTDDYIIGIKEFGKEYDAADLDANGFYKIKGWGDLLKIFKELDSKEHRFQFEFYDYDKETKTYELITDDQVIVPYTKETLSSQNLPVVRQLVGLTCTNHFDFFGCLGSAFKMFGSDFTLIFRTLKVLLFPSGVRQLGVKNLSSVIGIFAMIQQYIGIGFIALIAFMAMLSVNIGIMNLLPIPALDGGRIVFLLVEAVTKKKIPKKVEAIINYVFLFLLFGLFIYISINDVMRFF